MIDKDFYKLKGLRDKSKDSNTHKAVYFSKNSKIDIPFQSLKDFKDKENTKDEDKIILNEFINGFENNKKKFTLTPQETFYCSKISDIEKKIEYLIYRYKFRTYPENKILTNFPIHVLFEPTSICNLRCIMCYQSDKSFTGDNVKLNSNKKMMGHMSLDLFKISIDECDQEGAKAISIGSRGEPMLNVKFNDMLDYLSTKKNFFDVKINTNGSALNEKNCNKILDSNVNIIVISSDGENKDLYEKIRINGNFDKLLKNVELLMNIREKNYKNSKLEIRISGVYFHKDQNSEKFFKFWKDRVDNVSFVKAQNRFDTYNNDVLEKNNHCDFLWEKLYIWWDGIVNPCDEDYKSLLSPGNVKFQSIKDIWNGNSLNNLRSLHIQNQRKKINPCNRCGV
jgi:MoaA/NifB/PqqE/SkfB family radical SAM enzyme